jgi:6-phosphogluconolactonase/glucosamine-6-phosphate isomerase/deaminase
MISGQEKRKTLAAVMNKPPDPTGYSVHFIWPILDRITWFIDRAAAPRFFWDADGIA